MTLYGWTLVLKFLGVATFAGGLAASFLSSVPAERKRAVHQVASPGLLLTWVSGYALVLQSGVGLFELWVVGGLALSFASNAALVVSATRATRSPAAVASAVLPIVLVIVLMVFRPTWQSLVP